MTGPKAPSSITSEAPPGQYPERPLVCSVGLSPQVVTETLFALAVAPPKAFLPTALHLVTTSAGAPGVEAAILRVGGALDQMADLWAAPTLSQLARNACIHVVSSKNGDMSEESDLVEFASFATTLVRRLTEEADSALHVSLSGGRKSTSAAWALAIALFGRAQDRLSHVLVDEAFSNHPSFFFPTPRPSLLLGPAGKVLDAQKARVYLSELPFPRLRAFAPASFDDFATGVGAFQIAIDRVRLRVDIDAGIIAWGHTPLKLAPALKAWLAVLADNLLGNGGGIARVGTPAKEFFAAYSRLRGLAAAQRLTESLADPLDPEWIEEKCSRLDKALAKQGIAPRGGPLVTRTGARALAKYRLALDPAEIHWTGMRLAA